MSDALCTEQQQQLVLSATSSECYDLDSIIDEIVSWVPAKSLLRFRCVSKSWRALISNPYFIRKHFSRINLSSSSSSSLLIKNYTFRTVECEQLLKCLSHDEPLSCRSLEFPAMCGEVGSTLKMWVLKNYGVKESWTEVISIPSEAIHDEYNYMTCISENGEVLMQSASKGSLALYNPKEKKFRTLMDYGGYWYQWYETATYIETLVSPFIGSNGPSV